jgi:lipopolysaccharide biosynthesis protein
MKFPAFWKIRRETRRIGRQIAISPVILARMIYFRRWYDAVGSRKVIVTAGKLAFGREIGIYLIFPTDGVLEGHLQAIDLMAENGITPIVVSNLELGETDLAKLVERAGWIIQRPNVGYDFGGYRDAILRLSPRLRQLDRLWIMNDSVWIVPQPVDWFVAARALDVDFAGATSHYGVRRAPLEDFETMQWVFDTGRRKFHYQSYALCVGSRLLNDPKFERFWRTLEIRNEKPHTVRVGEIGLSQWVIRNGYTHGATWEIDTLADELDTLSNEDLDAFFECVVVREDKRLKDLKKLVDADSSRAHRIAFILAAVSRQAGSYAFSDYGQKRKGYHFTKRAAAR